MEQSVSDSILLPNWKPNGEYWQDERVQEKTGQNFLHGKAKRQSDALGGGRPRFRAGLSLGTPQQRRSGRRRHANGRPPSSPGLSLGKHQNGTLERRIPSAIGQGGENPQTKRRGSTIGHPHRTGQDGATVHPPGVEPNLGEGVLGLQLRIPTSAVFWKRNFIWKSTKRKRRSCARSTSPC